MPSEEDRRRAESIFHAALERPAEDRETFLAEQCAGDDALRREVESLLEHAGGVDDFLARPVVETIALDQPSARDRVLGPYRLLRPLGRGGMGEVWLAEQSRPIRRTVAVKLIRAGMDSRDILARFEAERQALALMDHPGVARVLDAGATGSGEPYVVMEYVDGRSITDYCDEKRLGLRERLELLRQVCLAIEHAHQKTILHRDIKPSNVLVTEVDGRPAVKVIDFGVAKAMGERLREESLHTRHGAVVGTPEYMSPEQSGSSEAPVDTRSDVYSLGVLLYELLVGGLPYDSGTIREALSSGSLGTMYRTDPPLPAARFRQLREQDPMVAERRSTTADGLESMVRGELEWITMTAISADPDRRYQAPSALAEDLQRYLEGQPVVAAPESRTYRLRKFVRRNRTGVVVGAAVALGLVVGGVGMAVGLVRALEAERIAQAEAVRANREARTASTVADFLVEVFDANDASNQPGETVTARALLDAGVTRIDEQLADQPEIRSELLETMGRAYTSLNAYAPAESTLVASLTLREGIHGPDHPERLQSANLLAQLYEQQGRHEEAEVLYREVLAARRRTLDRLDSDLSLSVNNLAVLLHRTGQLEEARDLFAESIDLDRQRLAAATDPEVRSVEEEALATSLNNYSLLLQTLGDLEESERALREALELLVSNLGELHPDVAVVTNNVGLLNYRMGHYAAAESSFVKGLELNREIHGEVHTETARSMQNLATARSHGGDFEGAEQTYSRALAVQIELSGPEHSDVGVTLLSMGSHASRHERYELAEERLDRAIRILAAALGEDHWYVHVARKNLGQALLAQGRRDEAEAQLLRAHAGFEAALGPDHGQTRQAAEILAQLYAESGRPEEAARYRVDEAGDP